MEGLESYHQTVSYVCTDRLQPPRHEACEVCSLAADRSPGPSSRVAGVTNDREHHQDDISVIYA